MVLPLGSETIKLTETCLYRSESRIPTTALLSLGTIWRVKYQFATAAGSKGSPAARGPFAPARRPEPRAAPDPNEVLKT